MQQKRQRERKAAQPHTITKAVTHIRLTEANPGKLAALERACPSVSGTLPAVRHTLLYGRAT